MCLTRSWRRSRSFLPSSSSVDLRCPLPTLLDAEFLLGMRKIVLDEELEEEQILENIRAGVSNHTGAADGSFDVQSPAVPRTDEI